MIAVVTGGSGFIGKNLVERLVREGHQVRCLVRPGGGVPPAGASVHPLGMGDARATVSPSVLRDADVVFHLAGATRALRSADFVDANVTLTRRLLDAVAADSPNSRFVFVSSQAAAGPASAADRPVVESDPSRPVEPYGESKRAAEVTVESCASRLATVVVRPSAVFGPHDRDFLTLFRMAQRGIILYPGVKRHLLSLIAVQDVVEGLVVAATSPSAVGRTYFLTAEPPVTWRGLGGIIADAVGGSVRHVDVPLPLVQFGAIVGEAWGRVTQTVPLAVRSKAQLASAPYWVCSGARAERELGVRSTTSLAEAIRHTYLWYVRHGWLRDRRPSARVAVSF